MSFAVASAALLATIRLFVSEPILINIFGWPDGSPAHGGVDGKIPTMEAAASMTSICHSTLLCTGLIVAFMTQPYSPAASTKTTPTSKMPQWWKDFIDALIQFCTGYMIYDAVVNIIVLRMPEGALSMLLDEKRIPVPTFGDDDILFLAHHIMTSFYMTSSRIIGAGQQSAMICMLLGELSNPLHNSFMIGEVALGLECCNGPFAQSVHNVISVAFAIIYNLLRVIIGPFVFAHVSYTLLVTKEGRTNINLPIRILWNLMIWGVVFGSTSWILKCHGIILSALSDCGLVESTTASGEEL